MPNTELPKYFLFLDTSCLFTKNESQIVSLPFTKLFRDLQSKCDVQLAIPRIVVDELLSQKLFQCEKFLEKAASNLRKIAKLTESEVLEPSRIQQLRQKLAQRLDRWIADLGATVVPIPDNIDWPALINDAVWRQPPFSPRIEGEETTEKGFKDAIILESLLSFHKDAQDRELVFLCADGLLSTTASDRLNNQPNFRVMKSLETFGSHVDLQLKRRGEEWAAGVLGKVGSVFFSENDPNCLWFRFGILERVRNAMGVRLTGFFGDVYEPHGPTYLYPNATAVGQPLKPVTEEFASIGETIFVPFASDGFYHWQTNVELRQIFQPKQVPGSALTDLLTGDRLRKLIAHVKWKCRISPEMDFTDETIDRVEFGAEKFERPGYLDYTQLRHPFYSQPTGIEDNTEREPTQDN
jgi:hypothetical protein